MGWIFALVGGLFVTGVITWIGVNLWYAYTNWHYDDGLHPEPSVDDYIYTYAAILIGLSVLAGVSAL